MIQRNGLHGSRQALVWALRARLEEAEQSQRAAERVWVTGLTALDRLLPLGGFRDGSLAEWLSGDAGSGVATLALASAWQACQEGRVLVVVDRGGGFYPPAARRLGIDLDRVVLLRPRTEADECWALDQALRSRAVGAALAWPETLSSTAYRRLQLAAEEGGGLGCLIRSAARAREPSWAEVRLRVEALPGDAGRRMQVELLAARGARAGGVAQLEFDDDRLFPREPASPTRHRRRTPAGVRSGRPRDLEPAGAVPRAAGVAAGVSPARSTGS